MKLLKDDPAFSNNNLCAWVCVKSRRMFNNACIFIINGCQGIFLLLAALLCTYVIMCEKYLMIPFIAIGYIMLQLVISCLYSFLCVTLLDGLFITVRNKKLVVINKDNYSVQGEFALEEILIIRKGSKLMISNSKNTINTIKLKCVHKRECKEVHRFCDLAKQDKIKI